MQVRPLSILALLALVTTAGCAGRHVQAPDAPLGRVIIYRNGVAYFERRAVVQDELTLDVPSDRVDDFLKSLTVVDAKTGKSLPVSYQTQRTKSAAMVQMKIELPGGRRDVRIAYVTESPAWKPSYRLMLDDGGKARLQSWAIVDNVSGEPWKHVRVGVGSTSALSFRYDLHSVQTVERETIDSGVQVADAPPEGGSPYAVEGANVRVLADLSSIDVDNATAEIANTDSAGISLAGTTGSSSARDAVVVSHSRPARHRRRGKGFNMQAESREFSAVVESSPTSAAVAVDGLAALTEQLRGNEQRVRIEGWGKPGETNAKESALRRANTLRERLTQSGIAEHRIEVVGHAEQATQDKLVRIVAIEGRNQPVLARDDDEDQPRGVAHFMTDAPMTVAAGHSAMITLFDKTTNAERVYLYDAVSERGSKRYAFSAVRVVNPSDNTLDSGPITVYAKQQFLGEGLTEPIPPKSAALVPYALDRSLVIEPQVEEREEVDVLQTIERGIATTQSQRVRKTVLDIANRGQKAAHLFVRHRVPTGWSLRNPPEGVERMRGDVLVPTDIAAGEWTRIEIEEAMPITTSIDLHSAGGLHAIAVFLKTHTIAPDLKGELDAILAVQRKLETLDDTLTSRRTEMAALRERVTELSGQLVELRKVGRAQALSGHLAKRMRTVGDRLDEVAAEVSDLEGKRLETGIELANLVAELSLERSDATTTPAKKS